MLTSPVEHVERESLLGQIIAGYSLLNSNETTNWIASARPEHFLDDLAASKSKGWAITGSFAASPLVSVAAPEIAVIYAEDPERIATATLLRRVRNGGHVVIALPYDQIVFERTWTKDNAIYISPAQAAIDCLTGPRRVLLDALTALQPHIEAVVLIGAQAVYFRTAGRLPTYQPFTTDADLVIDPGQLADGRQVSRSTRRSLNTAAISTLPPS